LPIYAQNPPALAGNARRTEKKFAKLNLEILDAANSDRMAVNLLTKAYPIKHYQANPILPDVPFNDDVSVYFFLGPFKNRIQQESEEKLCTRCLKWVN
jgi:hypothetical protein